MSKAEGVIKFQLEHTQSEPVISDILQLESWRSIFYKAGLIGQDPGRYGGAGYGNVSIRLEPFSAPIHQRSFLITGTQTGHLSSLTPSHYAHVKEYHWKQNKIISDGPIKPSSESLTHGAIYNLDSKIRFVLHVHSPQLWKNANKLNIPISKSSIPYGTPQMAEEVNRLFKDTGLKNKKIFSMGGHEDGIISFGTSAQEACGIMLRAYASALN